MRGYTTHAAVNAKRLRQDMTPMERRLWMALRSSQLGVKFRRQQAIGPYISDFLSFSHRLIIEIDGDSHSQSADHDRVRDLYLQKSGFRVLRFSNLDVQNTLESVLDIVSAAMADRPPPRPSPAGGEGAAAVSPSPLAGEGGAATSRRVTGGKANTAYGGPARA